MIYGDYEMTKLEMTELIMAAKNTKGVSWSEISTATGMSDVFIRKKNGRRQSQLIPLFIGFMRPMVFMATL